VPYTYDDQGRRVAAATKGQRREHAILDEAEKQLVERGADAMTVESIATAAGITRASLYFYFRSKNDVLAALVSRAVGELTSGVSTSTQRDTRTPAEAIEESLRRTALLWTSHGAVLRAAVDLSPSVASIGEQWNGARADVEVSVLAIVGERLAETGDAERGPVLVRALVAMTERELYTASARGDVDDVVPVLATIWVRALRLA
jgi:TetR/AcrR family transcriptional regulator, ethionamide resistance regulator